MTFEARVAAREAARASIDAREADAVRDIQKATNKVRRAKEQELAALAERERKEEREALRELNKAVDKELAPLVKGMCDKPSNELCRKFVDTIRKLEATAGPEVSEYNVGLRVTYALIGEHLKRAPGIVGAVTADEFWTSCSALGGLVVRSYYDPIIKAARDSNVVMIREKFERFDAFLWGLRETPVDEKTTGAWKARIDPDPRAFEDLSAMRDAEAKEAEERRTAEVAGRMLRHQAEMGTRRGSLANVRDGMVNPKTIDRMIAHDN